MVRFGKWILLLAGASITFGVSCAMNMRDALLSGAMDYVSGTTSDALGSLLPLNDAINRALGL